MFDITDQDEELPDMSPQITRRLHQNSVPRSIGKSPKKGLKRRGTDPNKPVKEPAKINGDSVFYTDSSYLNVPMISRDRSSPSIGSNLSDPESCLDGCVFDDDDESILGWFRKKT
uniref:Uncharacterized protein n=1 Tax=Acrobeloides nanus TaxID=290746 RepID=A0A914DUS2_9BILA